MICRALLGLIVFLNANWLLAESYRIGPEVPVSEPTLGPIGTIGFRSSAVFDGENYLAVWEDVRSLKREIYAARITPAGEVLDPLGIPLGITTVNLVSPKAVWTGTRHVVLATSDDPSETGNSYLMALSQAGEILQSPKRFLDRGSGLAMAVLAGNVLILRAKPDGVVIDVLDEQGQLLEANLPFPGRSVLTLAAADRHALVVWTDQVGMFAVRLDSSGHVLDSTPLNIATTPYPASFRIASNGRDFLVVMHQLNSRVQARFVWADGSLGAPFVLSNEPVERAEVAAAWLDDRYVVAWTNAGSIFATELRSDGTLTSPGLVSRYAAVTGLSLAAGAGSVLAVWYGSGEQSGRKVYAKRTSDPSSTEILVSSAASRQTVPDLAANADEFAVTWLESLDREFEAAIASITISEGRTSGTKVLRQSEAGRLLTAGRFQPEGQHGWLLWEERALRTYPPRTAVRGQLVGPSGTETIVFSDFEKSGAAPTLVRGDSLSIVLWIEQLKVHGSLVAVNGRDLATFQISTAPPFLWETGYALSRPAAAWDGSRFLVVWSLETWYLSLWKREVFGAFVEVDGSVSPPFTIQSGEGTSPAVAWNGSEFLIIWSRVAAAEPYRPRREIRAARVSRSGEVRSDSPHGMLLIAGDQSKFDPALVWTGSEFLVVWLEGSYETRTLRAARLSGSFEPISPAPLDSMLIAAAPFGIRSHAVAVSPPTGQVAIAYGRVDAESGGVQRIFVRILNPVGRSRPLRR